LKVLDDVLLLLFSMLKVGATACCYCRCCMLLDFVYWC